MIKTILTSAHGIRNFRLISGVPYLDITGPATHRVQAFERRNGDPLIVLTVAGTHVYIGTGTTIRHGFADALLQFSEWRLQPAVTVAQIVNDLRAPVESTEDTLVPNNGRAIE
jgi:hypothetical protein